MTYLISEDIERSLITVTLSGSVNDDEILMMMDDLYTQSSFLESDQFIDFSKVERYAVTPGGVMAYTDVARERPERSAARADRNIVVYAPGDLTFGMARLMASVADAAGIKVWVFRDLTEALSKIGLTENPTETIKNGSSGR